MTTKLLGRAIAKVVRAKATAPNRPIRLIGTTDIDGAGILHDELPEVDPFILLDTGTISKHGVPNFGAHPHRGHSVVTVILQGSIQYWDSFMENDGKQHILKAPASYWVDAGSGVFHNEFCVIPDESDPQQHARIFQLWVGVREEDRHKPSRVQCCEELPTFELQDAVSSKGPIGQGRHHIGPETSIETLHPISVTHILRQDPGTTYRHPVSKDHGGFVVHMSGKAVYGGQSPEQDHDVLVLAGGNDNDSSPFLEIATSTNSTAEYLICTGEPNKEPWVKKLVANGAIICATEKEAQDLAPQVAAMAERGKNQQDGSFAPFGK